MRAFALACFSILDQVVFDLNPCFNGRTIMVSKRWRLRRGKRWVLILILMEDHNGPGYDEPMFMLCES